MRESSGGHQRALRLGAVVIGAVLALHMATVTHYFLTGTGNRTALRWFHLDREENLPTLVSAAGLLMVASLFWAVSRREDRRGSWLWLLFCAIFIGLAVDEWFGIHERSVVLLRDALDLGGVLYLSWVLPYSLALVVLACAVLPALRRVDPATRRRLLVAAAVYVAGALLIELPEGARFEALSGSTTGKPDAVLEFLFLVEETAEMIGIWLCARALVLHLVGPPVLAAAPSRILQSAVPGEPLG